MNSPSDIPVAEAPRRETSVAMRAILAGGLGAIGAGVVAYLLAEPTWLVALSALTGFVLAAGWVWMALKSAVVGRGGRR